MLVGDLDHLPAIAPDHLYPKASAVIFLGSESAWRAALAGGMKTIKSGKRSFVRGSDLIRYITGQEPEYVLSRLGVPPLPLPEITA